MPATKKTAAKKTAAKKGASSRKAQDAIALLRADHKTVSELFDQFEKTRSPNKKKALVEKICMELTVHAQLEEEIFYPAIKMAMKDKELVPEAQVEHDSVKQLIAQVQGVEPDGEMYDARVRVLAEYVKHHVKEEQGEMFAKAKMTKLDFAALGEQMLVRKQELLSQV